MNEMETIDLKELLLMMKKCIWLIIIVPIILAVGVGIYSYRTHVPMYESNSTMYVINTTSAENYQISVQDLVISENLLNDFREMARQRVVINSVIEELGLEKEYTYNSLVGNITINLKNDTRIMEIKVKDKDPNSAYIITDKLTETMANIVTGVMNIEKVNILDKPIMPIYPLPNNIKLNIMIAFVLGILISIGFIFVKEYFDNSLKTIEDVEKHLKLPVLANIPVLVEKK